MGSTFCFVLKGFSTGNLETPGILSGLCSQWNSRPKTRIRGGLGEVGMGPERSKPLGWLGFIRDEILPSYIGISKAKI